MSTQGTTRSASALGWAQEAHALVSANPRRARALAERALAAAAVDHDVEAEVAAHYALSWALYMLGDAAASRRTLNAGIRLAERNDERRGEGLLRRHLAFQLATDGELSAARRELGAAIALLSGRELSRSQVHRLEIHRRSRVADPQLERQVLADAARAVQALRRQGDALWEARLVQNRGALHLDRGDIARAEADFRRANELYSSSGAQATALETAAILAKVALLKGDVVGCLLALETIDRGLPPGEPDFNSEGCRVLALAQARLLPEARAAADAYLDHCARTGRRDYALETMLDLAAIAISAGDSSRAGELATKAGRSFAARGQPVSAALARTLALRARLLDSNVSRPALRAGLASAELLEAAGWRRDAQRARLLVARGAIAIGSLALAQRELRRAEPLARSGSVIDRIELQHAKALVRLAEGHRHAAERFLTSGLDLLDEYRTALGAPDLRANASGIGSELALDGLRIALGSNRPATVFAWSERLRASALRLPPVRPPADRRLRVLQAELRQNEGEIRAATATFKQARGAGARQGRLEAAIRDRARLVGAATGTAASAFDLTETIRALGERVLVEYVEVDGTLHALTLASGRISIHELKAVGIGEELDWLRFDLTRLGRAGARRAVAGGLDNTARTLEAHLLAPVLANVSAAPLVVIPTGPLHGLPWGTLPSLRGRSVVVAPSAAVWTSLDARTPAKTGKAAFVSGPRLRHAAAEVRGVAAFRPGAVVLTGKAATAEATLAAIDGAAIAHIACHGRFRIDNPLFSSLELADGPLNVYELQRLRRAPELVVLSACDLALSGLHPGDELLGLAAALLGMGTRTIVASVVPVPDSAGKRLMLDFHRNLVAGLAPAAALADAQRDAAFAGFVCLGSG